MVGVSTGVRAQLSAPSVLPSSATYVRSTDERRAIDRPASSFGVFVIRYRAVVETGAQRAFRLQALSGWPNKFGRIDFVARDRAGDALEGGGQAETGLDAHHEEVERVRDGVTDALDTRIAHAREHDGGQVEPRRREHDQREQTAADRGMRAHEGEQGEQDGEQDLGAEEDLHGLGTAQTRLHQAGLQWIIRRGGQHASEARELPLELRADLGSGRRRTATELLEASQREVLALVPAQVHAVGERGDREPEQAAGRLRERLLEQVTAPVRWTGVVARLAQEGCDTFVEIGPGGVLETLCEHQAVRDVPPRDRHAVTHASASDVEVARDTEPVALIVEPVDHQRCTGREGVGSARSLRTSFSNFKVERRSPN